jgi:hypothetical protein
MSKLAEAGGDHIADENFAFPKESVTAKIGLETRAEMA